MNNVYFSQARKSPGKHEQLRDIVRLNSLCKAL